MPVAGVQQAGLLDKASYVRRACPWKNVLFLITYIFCRVAPTPLVRELALTLLVVFPHRSSIASAASISSFQTVLQERGPICPSIHVLLLLCVHERVCAAFKVSSNQSQSIIHWFISTLRASCGCRLPNCAFMFAADAPSPAILLKRPAAAASACAYASAAADMCSLLVAAGYTPFWVRAAGAIF